MEPIPEPPTGPERTTAEDLLRHGAWIRALARGLVGDAATADDLVQETYVAALRHPPERRRSLRPWLKQVVVNAARQHARGLERRSRREEQAREPSAPTDPSEWAERLETERRLTDALAGLDEPFRSTLMLRYYEGLEPTEIARREGTPPGTVRWRVKRGLELLRERLDGVYGNRNAWSLALLPLARTGSGAATAVTTSSFALSGVLTMSVLWKVTGAAIVTVALAYGLAWTGALPRSFVPFMSERPAPVSFRPLGEEIDPPVVQAAPAKGPRETARRALLAAAPTPVIAEPATIDSPAPTVVQARVVDAAGNALRGVELRLRGGSGDEPVARTGADGRVELEVPLAEGEKSFLLELRSHGFGSRGEQVVAHAGETVFLGTIVLHPGGAVSGRVVDADGAPIEGARITVGDLETPERVLKRERLRRSDSSVPMTATARDGSFALGGTPEGFVRLWANADGFLASYTAPIEVRPGEESFGVAIVLEQLSPENLVRGIVLDPAGAPVGHARLDFRSKASGTTMIGDREAGPDGTFEFLLHADALLWLTARDPDGRYGAASASEIETGELDLVLQLVDVNQVDLQVLDRDGEAVERYAFEIVSPDGSFVHARSERTARVGGAATFGRPTEAFVVRIEAPGYELAEVGPLDPAFVSAGVELRVDEAPRLRGRVTDRDGPVADARVRLHELVPASTSYTRNGFRSRIDHNTLPDETKTDEDGRYLLTVRHMGTFVVRVERDGYAPAEVGPRELGAAQDDVLDVVLGRGGAIEGRVILPAGKDPGGRIVGLSRLDGYGRTVRVGPDGGYRFERLTPGRWMLDLRDEEVQPGTTITRSSNDESQTPYEELEWSCEVYDGETTTFDISLAEDDTYRLRGRFLVDGALKQAWVAKLVPREKMFMEDGVTAVLDPGGTFELTVNKTGDYWLTLMRALEGSGEQYVIDVVHLSIGEVSWERELRTGALLVEGAAAWDGEGIPQAVHLWEGPEDFMVLTVVAGDEGGSAKLDGVPAGKARLVLPDRKNFKPRSWETLLEVEVPEGGESEVRLR